MVLAALLLVGILYWYIKDREKRLKKWERLEKEKIQSQFETLRNQVNPHFLFNSFNTLVSEIEDDPKRAVEYVERLSDFFRSIVTYREKDLISLKEELNIIKDYLFIQRKRYGCAFAVDINITAEQEKQYMIAPLTMQLLAENAMKHNAILKDKPLLLEMFIEKDWLIVRNNINPKMQPEVSTRLGLQNIIKRYELLTGKNVIINKDEKYFTVQIPIIKKL
jgi:LytS/YehU family sensor histidine kinase